MPRGDKSSYMSKQKRKAQHIEEGYEKRGVKKKEAERRAWATVNRESGGGKKSGSPRPQDHKSFVEARRAHRRTTRRQGFGRASGNRTVALGQEGRGDPQTQRRKALPGEGKTFSGEENCAQAIA
jgi:plasmid stabilization system protein ParE